MQRANGPAIRAIRQGRGETIEQVAVRAQMTAKSLHMIETGGSQRPRALTLRAIAKALKVDLSDITIEDAKDDDDAAVSA